MKTKAKPILLLGTASHVGKSVLTAGLCRVLRQDGYKVAPFKAQNMALNSFITADGLEMGRAQVTQAEAAGLAPEADMNPILLKPTSDTGAQVIIHGLVRANMDAVGYHQFKSRAAKYVQESYERLSRQYEVIVCEGAGSPAEINLREGDLVNMGLAEMIDAPCVLIGDIDRGGVFASLYGTVELLEPEEQARIKGLIINKFRGDVSLLTPGLSTLEEKTGKPVLGVAPYFTDLYLPEEDGVAVERANLAGTIGDHGDLQPLTVSVIRLPHIVNFTDFDALAAEPGLKVEYITGGQIPSDSRAVILPGTKNTIGDLAWVYQTGLGDQIRRLAERGTQIIGICGGYQMLGQYIEDPERVETKRGGLEGFGILPVRTTMAGRKQIAQVRARVSGAVGRPDQELTGYEIHNGRTDFLSECGPVFRFFRNGEEIRDGATTPDGLIWGTYLHGLFDDDGFRRWFVADLYARADRTPPPAELSPSYEALKEDGFNKLADLMRASLDMDKIYRIIGL